MIGRRSKILLFFYMIFLVVLFLMCSTDLIIREPEKEVYQVAVIIEDVRDDNYSNFRKGMDQAAIEFNADVHFITLYEKLDAEQQMELILREEQDGADALIVVPVDERQVKEAVAEKRIGIPVVLFGTKAAEEKAAGEIIVDYRKMGEQMAEQMAGRISDGCPVLLLAESHGRNAINNDFLEGAAEVLESGGHSCLMAEPDETGGYKNISETLSYGPAAILAGSPESLSETAGVLSENPFLRDQAEGLFGRGNTLQILNDLDGELITGICVTDEFSRGYFSVSMAVQALEGKSVREPMVMDSYYIEKKDLREPEYEKILFPVE